MFRRPGIQVCQAGISAGLGGLLLDQQERGREEHYNHQEEGRGGGGGGGSDNREDSHGNDVHVDDNEKEGEGRKEGEFLRIML